MEKSRSKRQLDKKVEQLYNEILDYKKKIANGDPDVSKLNDIMMEVAFVGADGRNFEKEPYGYLHDIKYSRLREEFYNLMGTEVLKLTNSEYGLNADELQQYFNVSLRSMSTLNSLGDENNKQFLNSLCGAYYEIKKRVRDYDFSTEMTGQRIYNDDLEFYNILMGFQEYMGSTYLAYETGVYRIDDETNELRRDVRFDTVGMKVFDMMFEVKGAFKYKFSDIYERGKIQVKK